MAANARPAWLEQPRDDLPQEALDFRWVLECVTGGGRTRLLIHNDPNAASLKHAKRIFISKSIADVNGKNLPRLWVHRFQEPEQGFALIPIDIRLKLVDFLASYLA